MNSSLSTSFVQARCLSPRKVRAQSPSPYAGKKFLRDSNSMLAVVSVFKIALHVEAVARRNVFLFGAVGHRILLGRRGARGQLRRAGFGRDFHARLLFESAGLQRHTIRNRVHRMHLRVLLQFLRALLAAGAFAGSLRSLLFRVRTPARIAALVALRRARLLRIARLRSALAVWRLLLRAVAGLLIR